MTTIAGATRLGDGSPATSVPLRYPYGVAQDAAGNIYFADSLDNRVRRVGTDGKISTIAGTGRAGFSGDNGPATKAMFDSPQGIRLDGKGDLYIADYNNNRVRMLVLGTGVITTVAGTGDFHFSGDKGPATQAGLDPDDIALDTAGNLYIADYLNNRVRKVAAADGTITTIAGLGSPADSGDTGVAINAALHGPTGISVDSQGVVYFIDAYNNRVRKIDQSTGKINTAVGTGGFGYGEPNYDGDGGLATDAYLVFPFSTAVEPNGNLLVLCAFELWRVTPADGKIRFVAGSDTLAFAGDGGAASSAKFAVPFYVSAAPNDDILIADVGNYRVRRIHSGTINTVAGTSILDGIQATSAFLNQPDGVLPDGKGGLLIGDTGDSRVRIVPASGIIANVAGTGVRGSEQGELFFPRGMALDAQGGLYIADQGNDRVMRLPAGGVLTVAAGGSAKGFGGDGGLASQARLSGPRGVAVDTAGNLYIADFGNSRVRMVDQNGNISTLAGDGVPLFFGDDGPAKNAQLSPSDVALDSSGNLFIADSLNHRIRKINLATRTITTVAGIGTGGYTGDGGPATSAQLKLPTGIALDAAGNLYIADSGNSVVRRISAASGVINTIAGTGRSLFDLESGTAIGVSLDPARVTVDKDGTIYIADQFNDRIRKLSVAIPASMAISFGNGQSGQQGGTVSIGVKIADASGALVGNVLVSFTVTGGSASLSAASVQSGADGIASIQVTLGNTVGPVKITAASAGLSSVTFNLTVTQLVVVTPQPQINDGGVEGAALSVPAVQALSSGGIASAFGKNFGGGAVFQKVATSDLVNGQVPVNFHGICVEVAGTRSPVFGASDTQVNFQVPAIASTGMTAVRVIAACGTANELASNMVSVAAQPATPEFFYFVQNANGINPVAATDAVTGAGIAAAALFPGSGFAPAHPSQYVTVYATGFADTNPPVAAGAFPAQLAPVTAAVTVLLGGRALPAANVLYVGITPGSPGLYQLNLLLPADTPNGDLPLIVHMGSVQSPAGAYLTVLAD